MALKIFIISCLFCTSFSVKAQNDIMLQSFYWDVPVDAENKKGLWWNNLSQKADDFRTLGITGLWIPAPSKGNWGIYDMGYGVYDHYDLGNYYQKGSVETRFGSRDELENMVRTMHDTTGGKSYIDVYADIILNHMYASEENLESNPVVKQYVFDEAYRQGEQHVPYPTNEIRWVLPDAEPGEYLITVKGYHLDVEATYHKRGYEIQIDYAGNGFHNTFVWADRQESNEIISFPNSGSIVRNFIQHQHDIDTYQVVVTEKTDIISRLSAWQINGDKWEWANQTNGYYPAEVRFRGADIAPQKLEAHTTTKYFYPERKHNEPQYQWNYSHFQPADSTGWLGDWGEEGALIPHTKAFGNDLNTFDPLVRQRLKDWGRWLVEEIHFDGFRLDFVWGYQPSFAAAWINNLPLLKEQQRFIVSEYWGPAQRIHQWAATVKEHGAQSSVFDFPLKFTLTEMCNGDESFDMKQLNHAGLIRNKEGHHLPASSVVTFIENHDTGKEHDKWISKDWHLAHAYMLTHEGRPCLFYPHLYGVTLEDMAERSITQEIPAQVAEEIRKLSYIRRTYLGGKLEVLSQTGNPQPTENISNIYVARRQGNQSKDGAIIVINNSPREKELWVDATPAGFTPWIGAELVNAFHPEQTTMVDFNGRVRVSAPARGYAIYILKSDFILVE